MAVELKGHEASPDAVEVLLKDSDGFWHFVDPANDAASQRAFTKKFITFPSEHATHMRSLLTPDAALQGRLGVTARVRGDLNLYSPDTSYTLQYGNHGHADMSITTHLDAPCAFTLEYKRTDNEKEVIAVVSFLPSLKDKTLYIDQIQGGGGFRHQSSQEARRIRFKLRSPEDALVGMAIELARTVHFEFVAIRKSSQNKYDTVTSAARKGKETHYDRTISALGSLESEDIGSHVRFRLA